MIRPPAWATNQESTITNNSTIKDHQSPIDYPLGTGPQLRVQAGCVTNVSLIVLRYSGYIVSRRPSTTSRGSPNFFVNSSTNGFFSGTKCGTLSSSGRPSNVDTHGGPIGEIGAAESWKLLV